MGGKMSIYGDIYSFGILILESFTGKRPTDNMFSSGLNLHDFVKMAIPHQALEITDPVMFETKEEGNMTKDIKDFKRYVLMEECLALVYQIGIACSIEFPRDRLHINKVIEQLQYVKETFLERVSESIRR